VIASGGVGSLEHLASASSRGAPTRSSPASVFHFGEITISDAKRFLAARGIEMRL
jgi:cyclase